MGSQGLGNIAWACGTLGYRDDQLLRPVYQTARNLLALQEAISDSSRNRSKKGSSGGDVVTSRRETAMNVQELSILCWAAAVLDMQAVVEDVQHFAAACSTRWSDMDTQGLQQLYQVHMWLQDHQPDSPGLLTALSEPQLQQCKEAWEAALAAAAVAGKASPAHQAVFAAAERLGILQGEELQLEARTPDGLISIDILARVADGTCIALEVDGHFSHFRQPDLQPTGTTLWRNRALETRGYVVVSVPYWEWNPLLQGGEVAAQVVYLEGKVGQAMEAAGEAVVESTGWWSRGGTSSRCQGRSSRCRCG
jgi:hypothetical protein